MRYAEDELMQRLQAGETNTAEFKSTPPRTGALAERLCGLANTHGGVLIIGVGDHGNILGVNARKAADALLQAARTIQPTLVFEPPEPEVYTIEGKKIVVATIPGRSGPLYQAGGTFWTRRGTYTVPLNIEQIFQTGHDRGLLSWELQMPLDATLGDIDENRVYAFLKQRSPTRKMNQLGSLEDILSGLRCARRNERGEVLPTNAGLLFFGRDPQQYMLQSDVVCVLFRNTTGTGGYVDRKNVTGTIVDLIDETEAFLNKYVAIGARIEGWKRIDLPEYALEALREAVVNAIVHRDYSRDGESVRVFYFPDRIEIHSPGLLLPGITVEQMRAGKVSSKLRNPVLTSLLREVPGYMERIGSGVRFMLQETKEHGFPVPIFEETDEFVVTFPKDLAQDQPPPEREAAVEMKVELRLQRALRYVQQHGSISNREYQALNHVSDNTAGRDLALLVSQGQLKEVGRGRGRVYKLA